MDFDLHNLRDAFKFATTTYKTFKHGIPLQGDTIKIIPKISRKAFELTFRRIF